MGRKISALVVGLAVAAVVLGLVSADRWDDTTLFGRAQALRGPVPPQSSVVLVAVDGASQDAIGGWPWSPQQATGLLQKLASWGVRIAVLDRSFADILLGGDKAFDATFWRGITDRMEIVLPLGGVAAEGFSPACRLETAPAIGFARGFAEAPSASGIDTRFCRDRIRWGIDSLPASTDAVAFPLAWRHGDSLVPSLPLAALLATHPADAQGLSWWDDEKHAVVSPRGETTLDPAGRMWINFYGAIGVFPKVSASDVLLGNVVDSYFRDKIAYVGVTTSTAASGGFAIPFSDPGAGNRLSRAELQATALANLLEASAYHDSPLRIAAPWVLFAALAILCAMALRASRRWPFHLLAVASLLVFLATQAFCFLSLRLWFDPLPGLLLFAASTAFLVLWPRPEPETEGVEPATSMHPRVPRFEETTSARMRTPSGPLPVVSASSPESGDHRSALAVPTTAQQATAVVEQARAENDSITRNEDGEVLRIGRYDIVRRIAAGGMGEVFEAVDPVMDRRVAIKILRRDGQKVQADVAGGRFLREARAAGSLHHPNINTVYDFGQIDNLLFLVLEYIEGHTLGQWIKEHSGVQPVAIIPWLQQIASALDTAHQNNIVHRDVKPSNFMIVKNTGLIKLMDFGVASMPDVTLTQAGMTVGTPNYMSPEQLQGSRVGPASDQYSLGVVVYQMLTQRVPFHGENLTALCGNILKGQFTRLTVLRPDIPKGVSDVVHRAFAARHDERFSTCGEFIEAYAHAAR